MTKVFQPGVLSSKRSIHNSEGSKEGRSVTFLTPFYLSQKITFALDSEINQCTQFSARNPILHIILLGKIELLSASESN